MVFSGSALAVGARAEAEAVDLFMESRADVRSELRTARAVAKAWRLASRLDDVEDRG